jgi:hypothetical protein
MPKNNFLIIFFIFIPSLVFSWGKAEEAEQPVKNNEWVLCVTNFNISGLSEGRRVIGEVLTRDLVSTLTTVEHRIRVNPEYAFYEGYAWSQTRAAAAKVLAAKRNERDLLLYRGDPSWKYKKALKTIDDSILKLEENLKKADEEIPLIAEEPLFKLTAGNVSGSFPELPRDGGEYRFCKAQNADAFLAGEVTEYHGRIYITVHLYALYANSYIYEDEIIFSPESEGGAVDEIAGRLINALSGSKPSAIVVHADPPQAMVLINKNFAGKGELGLKERAPGAVVVDLSAEHFYPQSVEVVLSPGELTEINVSLQEEILTEMEINIPGYDNISVYQGALYVGKAPLTLRLPSYQLEYITAEENGGRTAAAVFMSPDILTKTGDLSLKLKTPLPLGQKRVARARSRAYWAWGSTWIAGITAWVVNGYYITQLNGYNHTFTQGLPSETMYNKAVTMQWVNYGTIGLVILAAGHDFFQMLRYIHTSGADATPIIN